MQLTIYYDYTCEDSFQVFRWLERVKPHRPDLHLTWATFSLKELSRTPGGDSPVDPQAPLDPSLTALALAHAARQANFGLYHQLAFNAVAGQGRLLTHEALMDWARQAGIDWDDFIAHQDRWLQEAAHDQVYGRKRWGVRATPTLVFNSQSVAQIKLSAPPQPENRSLELLDRLFLLALDYPEVLSLRRPY